MYLWTIPAHREVWKALAAEQGGKGLYLAFADVICNDSQYLLDDVIRSLPEVLSGFSSCCVRAARSRLPQATSRLDQACIATSHLDFASTSFQAGHSGLPHQPTCACWLHAADSGAGGAHGRHSQVGRAAAAGAQGEAAALQHHKRVPFLSSCMTRPPTALQLGALSFVYLIHRE